MSTLIAIKKRLLTMYVNKLDQIVRNFKQEGLESTTGDLRVTSDSWPTYTRRLQEGITMVETTIGKVETTLHELASIHQETASSSTADDDFEDYASKSESAISNAFDYVLTLQARLQTMSTSYQQAIGSMQEAKQPASLMSQATTRPPELPPIPIPTFEGNVWEWDNFWEIFNTNVHSRDIPELVKFNYLLNALKGEASEAVRKFRVTKDNYSNAVQFLLNKYNNKEALVNTLLDKLESCTAKGHSIKAQRLLLEQVQVIVNQLTEKGENTDNSWLIKKVLMKFSDPIKKKVVAKKQGLPNCTPFTMASLLQFVDDILLLEETFLSYIDTDDSPSPKFNNGPRPQRRPVRCIYCRDNHPSYQCSKYTTPQDRLTYLRQHHLCLICASSAHATTQCKGRSCFVCNGRHHTSCCNKSNNNGNHNTPGTENSESTTSGSRFAKTAQDKSPKQQGKKGTTTSHASMNATSTMLQQQFAQEKNVAEQTFLPLGDLTVRDKSTDTSRKIIALLDTGAETSFIDNELAEELRLPVLQEKTVAVQTFGSDKVNKYQCKRVRMQVWDVEGVPHNLELLTHKILTRPLPTPELTDDDMEFASTLNPPIVWTRRKVRVKPHILLGCDYLWKFVNSDKPVVTLPSGMHAIPTKLGYLITGKKSQSQVNEAIQMSEAEVDETCQWDKWWSMETASINMVNLESEHNTTHERELWEKFWTLDAAGTEEFVDTEKRAREALDQKVWKEFNETIECRTDGYYVRLPWIEQQPHLPDNKKLAYKRLVNVWSSLSKNQQLLDQYNNVFEDQLRQNIIEQVMEDENVSEAPVHYIPHQPVITPQKTTTKLRIVYDASAHYKGCLSLNDVLHRGPVLLPAIYGILLRFRTGTIAMTSDVEKAFLQVRLQERDRDATRFLWLHNHRKPPSNNNILTFRFTRIAFGIKSSPFLLAGTTLFHLDTYEEDRLLIEQIKKNLYVDNLLLTTNDAKEAAHFYHRTKEIFRDIKMNLREFSSNCTGLMDKIREEDRCAERNPKVLGLVWDVKEDTLLISCKMPELQSVTKRAITSAIASIYDPLGWLSPILYCLKIFLQELWKEELGWDTELGSQKKGEWHAVVQRIQNFEQRLPRSLTPKGAFASLVVFADASNKAMATCTYLCYNGNSRLLMAKTKLVPLHGQYTIPKLELNAFTLAMRVLNSVLNEISSTVSISSLHLFTDSEVVLGWLKRKPEKDLGTFIGNRLSEIRKLAEHINQEHSKLQIGYVASKENPADCASRGLTKEELTGHFWWTGPTFLHSPPSAWPHKNKSFAFPVDDIGSNQDIDDFNEVLALNAVADEVQEIVRPEQARTITQATRIMAYVIRFLRNTVARVNSSRNNKIRLTALDAQGSVATSLNLSGSDITSARKALIRHHQSTKVTQQIIQSCRNLNIRPDEHRILRCYGRLGQAHMDLHAKNPIFILQKTFLADIIIRDYHMRGHPGINHTMAQIRQCFWIPQLRSQVSSIVRKCISCQKFNNLPFKYPTQEDLPRERVIRSRPFQHVGLDYFGPLAISTPSGVQDKCHGAIITCMTTRLVHLDVVPDQTTISFLNMLRRFFARRGVPMTITSDNAPTFELGAAILKEELKTARDDPMIAKELSNREIDWRCITPYAPWQGGFYERLVKSVKHSLYKTIGRSTPSLEELSTLLIEIEALLNSRPLTYLSADLQEDCPLRPIDFIQKDIIAILPLGHGSDSSADTQYIPNEEQMVLKTRQQTIQALEASCQTTEKFWSIWQKQYLTALREKHTLTIGNKKGCSKAPSEGSVVLISDPILPRYSWKMGRITQLVANSRGTIREAIVRLPSHRVIRRPLNLLIPLEIDDEDEEHSQVPHTEADIPTPDEDDSSRDKNRTKQSLHRYNLRKRPHISYNEEII